MSAQETSAPGSRPPPPRPQGPRKRGFIRQALWLITNTFAYNAISAARLVKQDVGLAADGFRAAKLGLQALKPRPLPTAADLAVMREADKVGVERFIEHVEQNGISDATLLRIQARIRVHILSWLVVGLLGLGWAIYLAWFGSVLASIVSIMMSGLMLLFSWITAFRHWQIRNRRLGGLFIYMRDIDGWWPTPGFIRPFPQAKRRPQE